MKCYAFLDEAPPLGRLVVIEGTERLLAERVLATVIERLLPPDLRDLNTAHIRPDDLKDPGSIRQVLDALATVPFLAERRVIVVHDAQELRAPVRHALVQAAASVPETAVLVICDLVSPRSQRPTPLAAALGRAALRIDTTASEEVRVRFIREEAQALGASLQPRAVAALAGAQRDLAAIRNDLQKLALLGRPISERDVEAELPPESDPKAYRYAGAVVEGRTSAAMEIAEELLAGDPRGATVPLLSALASELVALWETARPGGRLPARLAWRERVLRPIAARVGPVAAQAAHRLAVEACAELMTGRAGTDPEDHRVLVARVTAEVAALLRGAR